MSALAMFKFGDGATRYTRRVDADGGANLISCARDGNYDECRSLVQRGGLDLAADEKKYPVLGR